MTQKLNLEGVVFFEGPTANIEKWLRDKHTIVSSAIDAGGIAGVWTGMACGLRPLVHAFAGAEECVPQSALFTIAEDFCNHLRSNDLAAQNYRVWLEKKLKHEGFEHLLTTGLLKLERQIHLSTVSRQESPVVTIPVQTAVQQVSRVLAPPQPAVFQNTPSSGPVFTPPQPAPKLQLAFTSDAVKPANVPSSVPQVNLPWENMTAAAAPAAGMIPAPQPVSPVVGKTVNEVAEEALKASQRLRELLQQSYAREQADANRESLSVPFAR
jgi:hypothetical protein